jgi:two-component system sensor histidine kinase/response regulator
MVEKQDGSQMKMDEYTDLQAALPALEVRAGMRRAMGRRDTYLQLLHKFKCRFAGFPNVLQDYFAAGDMKEAVIQVHSLKGIAASIGAESLQSAAKELEQQLRRGESPATLARVEYLVDKLLQQLDGLDLSICKANTQSVCGAENTTPENSQNWCRSLKELQIPLQKLQVNKVKAELEEIQRQSLTPKQREHLEHLEHMVSGYKYKQAAEYIEGLL